MRTTVIVVALVVTAATGLGHAPAAAAQAAGWTKLFNGKDLSNWNVTGNADWRVTDGVIEATKARGFLLTRQSYGDFEMRAASRAARIPPLPESISSDSPDGDTKSVALPPSTSTT